MIDDAEESDSFYANNFGDENTPAIERSPTRISTIQGGLQLNMQSSSSKDSKNVAELQNMIKM